MNAIQSIEDKQKKSKVTDVKSGDVVRIHQKIKEGGKERVQIFEGLVIKTKRSNSHSSSVTVRRIASGIGVEKSFLMHSPLITQIEVVKRSKVRRNYLSYMRELSGKSARLDRVKFDKDSVNVPSDFDNAPPEEVSEAEDKVEDDNLKDKADEKVSETEDVKSSEKIEVEKPAKKESKPKESKTSEISE